MPESASKSESSGRQISEATERMAKILGVNFERNVRWNFSGNGNEPTKKHA